MQPIDSDFSLKSFFSPLTTAKAIHIIMIVGVIVFFNSLFNGFVWDDTNYLLENSGVHTLNIPLQFEQNLYNNAGQYRALTATYFNISYALFGPYPFFYHILQLVFHITNSIFVFIFLKHIFKRTKLSLALALLFLVHPLQVESVSYISSVGGVLFFFFGMIALLTLTKEKITGKHWVIIFISLLFSLLAKEAGVLFIVICGTYIYLFKKTSFLQFLFISSVVISVYLGIRIGIGKVYFESRPLMPIVRATVVERLLTIPEVLFYYISRFFIPINLSVYQQWVTTTISSNFIIACSSIITFIISIILFFNRYIKQQSEMKKLFMFFSIWTLAGLGLYSQIVPLDMTVADRWFYFPMVGFLGIIGVFVTSSNFVKKYYKQFTLAYFFILCIFSLLTIIRNTYWYDSIVLYKNDTAIHTNFLLENDYAQQLKRVRNYKEALMHQEKSVNLFSYEQNLLNLGDLYELTGNKKKAEQNYILALKAKSYIPWEYDHIVFSYVKYGKLLLKEKRSKEALAIINEGIKDYGESPNSGTLWYLNALILHQLYEDDEALKSAKKAAILLPIKASADLYTKLETKSSIDTNLYLSILP